MSRVVGSLLLGVALAGCSGMPSSGGGATGGPGVMRDPPTASPGCDPNNVCRVYVAMEKDSTGRENIYVYPEVLTTRTRGRDAHIVWIVLNDDVNFSAPQKIQIKPGSDATQWTDKYATDSDEGKPPGASSFRPKNFHGRFPRGSALGTYHYAITLQRGTEPPVTKDPTIVNSN